jgi:hypothetical protein
MEPEYPLPCSKGFAIVPCPELNPVHIIPSYFSQIRFNIILRSIRRYSQHFQDYLSFIILTILSGLYIT